MSSEPISPPPLTPAAKPFAKAIGASGLIEARRENTLLGVPVAGLVKTVRVSVWERVEKGAALLELDDREVRATLATQRAQVATAQAQRDAARAVLGQSETLLERLTVRAPISGTILQVNVRAGEYVSTPSSASPVVLGDIDEIQVRADVDEQVAPRVRIGAKAVGYLKGGSARPIGTEFVRIEPFVIPKRSLTGASTERVDTRVLQVIYRFPNEAGRSAYVGQQLDLYIEE